MCADMNFIAKTLRTIGLVLMLAAATTASAQYRYGGLLMDRDGMMSNDMFTLSQPSFGFGTARSMALSGAFTSLGGDISAMGINPAGLGMYRSNEVIISPMMGFVRADNSADNWQENSLSRFSMANLGVVFNVYEGSGALVSLNMAIGYNRVADLNHNYSYSSLSAPSAMPYRSINDAFVRQLGQGGVFPDAEGMINYDYGDAYYWGGMMAYNGYMLDVESDDLGAYWTSANRLGANASVGHTVGEQSRGSVGEYDLAMGMNIANKLYLGATLGLQVVNWKRDIDYSEDYVYSSAPVYGDGTPIPEGDAAQWMDYNQAVDVDGTGINFKLGLIYRPIPSLRLGAALHTPTFYSLERTYLAFMSTNFNPSGDTTPALSDEGVNVWEFSSPTRLMFGASYSIGNVAVISLDYERTWYDGMRVHDVPNGFDIYPDEYRQEFRDNFKAGNTLRAGVEVKPLPKLALRVGYGYNDGALRNAYSNYINRPLTYRAVNYSGGIGYSFGRTTIDVAYQRLVQSQTSYLLYYALDDAGVFDTASPYYSTEYNRDYVVMTLGFRF